MAGLREMGGQTGQFFKPSLTLTNPPKPQVILFWPGQYKLAIQEKPGYYYYGDVHSELQVT